MVVVLLSFSALHSVGAGSKELTAVTRVDSTEYFVGDWIRIAVEITHPRGATFQSVVGDTIGGYHVLDRSAFESTSDTTTTTGFVVARYDSGTSELPPLQFLASIPGDTAVRSVFTRPLVLTIHTVEVDPEGGARDIKPPMGIPYTLAEIILFIVVLLLLAGAGYLLYRFVKRRKGRPVSDVRVSSARLPHIVALEQLARLRDKKLWQQGRIKEYYSEITEILRRYFENRYGLMALEETTDEIVAGLRGLNLRPTVSGEVEDILRRADLVKFAKHKPVIVEHEQTLRGAYSIVEKTRPAAVTPEGRTRDHVGS
jgi:hypothetical protein